MTLTLCNLNVHGIHQPTCSAVLPADMLSKQQKWLRMGGMFMVVLTAVEWAKTFKISKHFSPLSHINYLFVTKEQMTSNRFKLKTNKTTPSKTVSEGWWFGGCSICPSSGVCNLGIIFDFTLSVDPDIKSITISAFSRLRNVSRFWPSLPVFEPSQGSWLPD